MAKLNKKDLLIIETVFEFLDSDKFVFLLSKKLVNSWIDLTLLSPFSDVKFPECNYCLIHKRRKYLLRELEGKYYILFLKSTATKEFIKLSKLSEVKRVTKVIDLVKELKQKASQANEITGKYGEDQLNWKALDIDISKSSQFSKVSIKKQKENKNFSDLSWSIEDQITASYGRGNLIYQSDYEEAEQKIKREVDRKERARVETAPFSSHFNEPDQLFDSVSFSGISQGGDSSDSSKSVEILIDDIEGDGFKDDKDNQLDTNLLELLPTPIDSYQEILSSLPREKMRARYFNPNFPLSSVVELNNSHYFWALISPQYRDVESFAIKLKDFYGSLSTHALEQLVCSNLSDQKNLWLELQQQTNLSSYDSKSNSFKAILDAKLEDLQLKNEKLTNHLNALKDKLLEEGKYPDTDLLYLQSVREKKKILEEIENTFKVLHNYSDRLQQYSEKHPDFSPNFYLSIFGSKAILSKYDSLVCNALLDLNDQLNEIVFYQQEVEKLLFDRLSTLHQARKAELKLEFLEQEDSLSKLVFTQQKTVNQKNRAEELRKLEIQGSLELSKNTIQKEIEAEKSKLSNYLDRLQKLDHYPDFEEQSQQLRSKKAVLKKRVSEYREEVYALKLKAEAIERQYSSFITAVREQILEFQKEISGLYAGHLGLLNDSVNNVWADWTNKGIDHLERILARKKALIKEFSEIIILELKNMYSTQDNLLEESRKRKREWERVYSEMVDEFKTLGYYLSSPKPSENYHRFLPKIDKSVFDLSPEMKRLIYYRPSLKYAKPKVNDLIGLSPKILNDDEFLVIDQVWTQLTPIQEHQLKEKILKESNVKDKQRISDLLNKAREDMNKRLERKNYKFKTLTLEKGFPKEADEEERYKKLKLIEKSHFHNWKEIHFTTSELRYKFKDMLAHLSKKLFTLKEVEQWGDQLNITDKGKVEDPELIEKLSEYDYFVKTSENLSLVDSHPIPSFKSRETDLYDLEDEGYLSILEALDEDNFSPKYKLDASKKILMPKLEDWSKLNLKRYREEKKKVDIVEIKEGLLALEKEIQALQKSSGNYREACELERNRRELLFDEMNADLDNLKKYLEGEEDELNKIFAEASDMIDLSFEEIDKRLDERRKMLSEYRESKSNS